MFSILISSSSTSSPRKIYFSLAVWPKISLSKITSNFVPVVLIFFYLYLQFCVYLLLNIPGVQKNQHRQNYFISSSKIWDSYEISDLSVTIANNIIFFYDLLIQTVPHNWPLNLPILHFSIIKAKLHLIMGTLEDHNSLLYGTSDSHLLYLFLSFVLLLAWLYKIWLIHPILIQKSFNLTEKKIQISYTVSNPQSFEPLTSSTIAETILSLTTTI